MSAGLRVPSGRERMRSRRAVPRVQAVLVVKLEKICSGLFSWAIRAWGWLGLILVVFFQLVCGIEEILTSVLGAERVIMNVRLRMRI